MSDMFTNKRDQQYFEQVTRNSPDGMSPEFAMKAHAAWSKAFKDIAPIDTAGFALRVNPNGSLTISKATDTLTMDFTQFQTLCQAALTLFAQFSDHEQTITLRAKP